MKVKPLLLPILLLSASNLSGCSSSDKLKPTFGSIIDTNYTLIKYADLFSKVENKESMIVVTYPGDNSSCSCWKDFQREVLPKVATETEYLIYAINVFNIIDKDNEFNLTLPEDRASIAFFANGKKTKEFVYKSSDPQRFFKDFNAFKELLAKYTIAPSYIYTDLANVDNDRKTKDKYIVQYTYHSCPDCSYVLPKVMFPYLSKNNIANKIYIVDLDNETSLQTEGILDKTKPEYQQFKDNFYLSDTINQTYGYEKGFVPTIHYYENGELKDASVYFNDTITKVDNEYIVTSSFYSQERSLSLHYLDNVKTKVLEGLKINEKDLTIYEEYNYISWNHEAANKYHQPLLEEFLNKYAK